MDIRLLFCVLVAWLIGGIPFSLLIARFVGGFDLRTRGSGNVGATNVARTMGPRWGIVALLLDAAKGGVPTGLLPLLFGIPPDSLVEARVLTGVAAILGHMFPVWLGFRGGKGVATALGVVVVLAPLAMGCAFLTFAIVFALSRIVSLSSMAGAVVFTISQFAFYGKDLLNRENLALGLFSLAVPLLIIIRHWPNIVRLWKGEEKPLSFKKETPEISTAATPQENDQPDAA